VHDTKLFSEKNQSVNSKGLVQVPDSGAFFPHIRLMITISGIILLYPFARHNQEQKIRT
jgi:hypothetical protein